MQSRYQFDRFGCFAVAFLYIQGNLCFSLLQFPFRAGAIPSDKREG